MDMVANWFLCQFDWGRKKTFKVSNSGFEKLMTQIYLSRIYWCDLQKGYQQPLDNFPQRFTEVNSESFFLSLGVLVNQFD